MTKYLVGLIATLADSTLEKFLFQSNNLTQEADEYEAKESYKPEFVTQRCIRQIRFSSS